MGSAKQSTSSQEPRIVPSEDGDGSRPCGQLSRENGDVRDNVVEDDVVKERRIFEDGVLREAEVCKH